MQAIFMRNIIQALLATPTNANVRQGEQVDGEKALIKTEKQARTVQYRPFSQYHIEDLQKENIHNHNHNGGTFLCCTRPITAPTCALV